MDDSRCVEARKRSPDGEHKVGKRHPGLPQRLEPLRLGLRLGLNDVYLARARIPLNLIIRADFHFPLRAAAKNLTHAPPLHPLHGNNASRLVDPQHARRAHTSTRTAREGARFELQAGAG